MEFECEKQHFAQAISTVSRAINPRSPLPILSHILIQAQQGRLIFSATDLDLGVTTSCDGVIAEGGSVAVPARLLSEIVAKLPGAPVHFRANTEGRVFLQCGRSKFELSTLPGEEFPSLPDGSSLPSFQVSQGKLRGMLRKVLIAVASSEESRAVMTGVKATFGENQLMLVATDGRRMAYLKDEIESNLDFDIILPGRAAQELVRVLSDSEELTTIGVSEGQLHCQTGSVSLHCRLLEGIFPDYRRVLPKEFLRYGRVGREALLSGLQRMLIVAQEKVSPNLVVLDINQDTLTLSANTPDVGIGSEEIAAMLDGEDLKIAFNGKYMADVLSVLDCDEVQIQFQDDTRSAVVKALDDDSFLYVIMPVRLRETVQDETEVAHAGSR